MIEYIKMWYYKLFGNSNNSKPTKKARRILNSDEVKEIENLLVSTEPVYTQVELAIIYGVSTSVLSKIKLGKHRYSTKRK